MSYIPSLITSPCLRQLLLFNISYFASKGAVVRHMSLGKFITKSEGRLYKAICSIKIASCCLTVMTDTQLFITQKEGMYLATWVNGALWKSTRKNI